MSRTHRTEIPTKRVGENPNHYNLVDVRGRPVPEPRFTWQERHRMGHMSHDICADFREGHLDTFEPSNGRKGKRYSKRLVAKAIRRVGVRAVREGLSEG